MRIFCASSLDEALKENALSSQRSLHREREESDEVEIKTKKTKNYLAV